MLIRSFAFLLIVLSCFCATESSYAQNWDWCRGSGGVQADVAYSVTTDGNRNVILGGSFNSSSIVFGTNTLANTGVNKDEAFLVKYDSSGNVIWAKSAGGTDMDAVISVATNKAGDVYAAGLFHSTSITFGSTTLTNVGGTNTTADVFIVKYDAAGNLLWAKSAGSYQNDFGIALAIDLSGNAYLTGQFSDSVIRFGSIKLYCSGLYDIFLTKYDPAGNVVWAIKQGTVFDELPKAIAVDASGNVIVTGEFSSPSIAFGSTPTLTNYGQSDVFVVKYNSSGVPLWARREGDMGADIGYGVGTDAAGNIYVGGSFSSSTIYVDTITLHNTGSSSDVFLIKYTSSGTPVWAKKAGGIFTEELTGLAVDPAGNAFVTGFFGSLTATFGTKVVTGDIAGGAYLAKYSPTGNVLWAKASPYGQTAQSKCVAIDTFNSVYMAGYFSSPTLRFNNTITNTGPPASKEIFIARLNPRLPDEIGDVEVSEPGISIYPNPSCGHFKLRGFNEADKVALSVFDYLGRVVYSVNEHAVSNEKQIDLPELPDGMYILRLANERVSENLPFYISRR